MFGVTELKRRLENIVQIGTISATKSKDGKALARVILDDDGTNKRVTNFLPVVSFANSFAKIWFPIRVNEQVIVFSPFGNADSGFIIRSIFNKSCKEPSGSNEHTSIIEFEDGTRLSYDTQSSDLKIDAVKSINVICIDAIVKASNSVNIETKTATLKADDVNVESTNSITAETKTAYLKADNATVEAETLVKGALTVQGLFLALGGMKVIPSEEATVGAEFECDIKSTKDIEARNIKATGDVTDRKGSLTNHTNNDYSRD